MNQGDTVQIEAPNIDPDIEGDNSPSTDENPNELMIQGDARIFSLVSAVSGPFTSRLAVCISFSWFSRSEVCAFVWGMVVRGVRVETFVRVLRSSRCCLLNNWK